MKKRPNTWLIFFSLAIQIGALMYLSIQAGNYLDRFFDSTKPWFTLSICVFALVAILRLIIHQTKQL